MVEIQLKVTVCPVAITEGIAVKAAVGTMGPTLTVAEAGALVPPGPEQVKLKAASLVSAPVLCEPLTASGPLQSPLAMQAVESVEVHVKVDDAPAATEEGLAVICTVGSGLTVTVTVAGGLVPPAPLHATVKLAVPVSAPVLCVPLVASAPLHAPDAVQDVALLEDQVSSLGAPGLTVVGEALIDAVGIGAGELELPPPQEASSAAALTSRILGINRAKFLFDYHGFTHSTRPRLATVA